MRTVSYLILLTFFCCNDPTTEVEVVGDGVATADPYTLPSSEGEALNVVIEIPAGTNHKIEYHVEGGYLNDTLTDGRMRVIDFLPYPGNYGFVPSTLMDKAKGGDGDALDVLVIGESVATGTVIKTIPIGVLLLRDRGEIDTKIIAVPANTAERVFAVDNFLDFSLGNDAAKQIVELWFLNYKGSGITELVRWEDEAYAWREVRKWQADTKSE